MADNPNPFSPRQPDSPHAIAADPELEGLMKLAALGSLAASERRRRPEPNNGLCGECGRDACDIEGGLCWECRTDDGAPSEAELRKWERTW